MQPKHNQLIWYSILHRLTKYFLPSLAAVITGRMTVMKSRLFNGTRNSWTMVKRSVRHDLRSVDALAMSVILPVMILVLFTTIFGGAINTGVEYINYVVPGVFIICLSFGTASTAVSVCD